MMFALIAGVNFMSCKSELSNDDNPATQELDPAKQELVRQVNRALREGAMVSFTYTLNGEEHVATFKRVGNKFELQPEATRADEGPNDFKPYLTVLGDLPDNENADDDEDPDDDKIEWDEDEEDYLLDGYLPDDAEDSSYIEGEDDDDEGDDDEEEGDDDEGSSARTVTRSETVTRAVVNYPDYLLMAGVEQTSTGNDLMQARVSTKTADFEEATALPDDADGNTVTFVSMMVNGDRLNLTSEEESDARRRAASSNKKMVVKKIKFKKSVFSKTEGTVFKLQVNTKPENAVVEAYRWSSTNSEIVTVENKGEKGKGKNRIFKSEIIAEYPGQADVKFSVLDGSKTLVSKACRVTVKAAKLKIYMQGVTFFLKDVNPEDIGCVEPIQILYNVYPAKTQINFIKWEVKKGADLVSVDEPGYVWPLTIVKKTATIVATFDTDRGTKTASCKVTINPKKDGSIINPASVKLDQTAMRLLIGETKTLTPTVYPSNATDQTVTWVSSNPSVATVDAEGNVTGVAAGDATITVQTESKNKTATCKVHVQADDTSPVEDSTIGDPSDYKKGGSPF